ARLPVPRQQAKHPAKAGGSMSIRPGTAHLGHCDLHDFVLSFPNFHSFLHLLHVAQGRDGPGAGGLPKRGLLHTRCGAGCAVLAQCFCDLCVLRLLLQAAAWSIMIGIKEFPYLPLVLRAVDPDVMTDGVSFTI